MSFETLQKNLREQGWFVEWNMPCCQSCAWSMVSHEDMSRVLFNHTQDCENEEDWEPEVQCTECWGHVNHDEYEEDCPECGGYGYVDNCEDIPIMTPDEAGRSLFCFNGDKEGTKNLVDILPLIEESGCNWSWDKCGGTRIEISW